MVNIAENNSADLLDFLRKRVASKTDRVLVSSSSEIWDEINSRQPPAFVSVVGIQKPYRRILGAHPEVVERVWDTLGSVLPQDCRSVVYAAPALVHPETGVIFVLALGTYYALRFPQGRDRGGAPAHTVGRDTLRADTNLDTKRDLGEDWTLGRWQEQELSLCLSAYEQFGQRNCKP